MPRSKIINKKFIKIKYSLITVFLVLLCGAYINSTTLFRLRLADYYVKSKDYDKTIAIYNKILRKEYVSDKYRTLNIEDISNIRFNLTNLFLITHRYEKAAQMLKQLFIIDPKYKVGSLYRLKTSENCKKFGSHLLRMDLNDLALKQFQRMVELEPQNSLRHYQLALFYQQQGMNYEANAELKKVVELIKNLTKQLVNKQIYLGDVYYNLALQFEKKDNIEKAKDYYMKAIEFTDSKTIGAYYRLISLYRKQGKLEDAKFVEKKLLNLEPEYQVNYEFSKNLMLLGYSLNEIEFELFNKGKISFFWQIGNQEAEPDFKKQSQSKIYKIRNRLHQIREVENLAVNFGFEADSIGKGFPYGWKSKIYGTFSENHEIVSKSMSLGEGHCLMLNNSKALRINCQTDYIATGNDRQYLQAGWIKTVKGNAFLGRKWFNSSRIAIEYNYVATDIDSPKWKYYFQVFPSPYNSKYCRLWIGNYETHGKAYFDDILFIELQLP